jgi:hypothetical protein
MRRTSRAALCHAHRLQAFALIVLLLTVESERVQPRQPAFPFSIVGNTFHLNGTPVFLNMISYQPLEPGQSPESSEIRLSRITDDLRRLRAFRGASDPIVLRVYEQPTAQVPQRIPKAFYDGVRALGFWVVRDIYFDPDFTAPDAITRGRAAIDRVIAEVEAAGAFDRIFAWEFGNEFAAEGSAISALETFLSAMRNHVKARMAQPARDAYSDWVTWASWPMSDPLRTFRRGNPILVPSLDYVSFNAYSYDPERMRDHQAGPGTGTPFAGYLAALKSRFPNTPLVLTETGLPDSLTAVGEDQSRLPPLYPSYRRGALSAAQVAEGLADRYWDARLSGAVAGFQVFQWADGWYKAGDPSTQADHPEESFGLCRFVTSPDVQLRCKLQLSTIETLYTLRLPPTPVLSGVTADSTFLTADGTTTLRAQLASGAVAPVRFRWESSRGHIVGDGAVASFRVGGHALGPAVITVVGIDAEGNATTASTTIDIQRAAPSLELLTFGRERSSGRVANVDLTQYKVVLYVRTNEFYVQPFADMKSIWITSRGYFWSSNFVVGDSATLHAWLVPRSYDPPSTMTQPPPVAVASAVLSSLNDNDNDLLPDSQELQPQEDRYSDPDRDGAANLDELIRDTDPHVADNDMDGDGLPDDWEDRFFGTLAYGAHQDPDGDGLNNSAELMAGTHPGRTHVDRDGDGLPDLFELRRLGTLSQGPLETNSGGVTNLDAYELGIVSPTISVIADQKTSPGTTLGPIPFDVADDDTAAADLVVSVASSNATVLPLANIVLGGSGPNRTVTLTTAPNQEGTSTVTLRVSDGEGGAAADTFTVTVTQTVPGNLRMTGLTASAASFSGAVLAVTRTTANDGPGPVAPTRTGLWLSTDKTIGGDALLAVTAVPTLAAGGKLSVTSNVTLPVLSPGRYYLIAQADMDQWVAETSESDNLRTRELLIGPDLTAALSLSPSSPTSSTPTTITVTTRNGGGASAQASTTRLYRSNNGKVDAASTLLSQFAVPLLAPKAQSTSGVALTLPAGTYYVIAVVDATGRVAEALETNNVKGIKKVVP